MYYLSVLSDPTGLLLRPPQGQRQGIGGRAVEVADLLGGSERLCLWMQAGCWQSPVPRGPWTEVPVSLQADSWLSFPGSGLLPSLSLLPPPPVCKA